MKANFTVPVFKTINEMAEFTGLAKYQIRKIVKSGKVKYIKAGVKFLINLESFLEYLDNGDNEKTTQDEKLIRKIVERKN